MKRIVKPLNAKRTCAECGATFTATHGRQMFCCPQHKSTFSRRMGTRGTVLLPLAMEMRRGKSGFNDQRRYALREFNALVDLYNKEDRDAGRRPDLIVTRKMNAQWRAADLND